MYGTPAIKSSLGVTVDEKGLDTGNFRRTLFRFTDFNMPLIDTAATVARAFAKLYTFPEGMNVLQSIRVNLAITKTSTGVNADFDGDFSLGTAAAAGDATLTGTEADVVATTATPQAVAGVSSAKFVAVAPVYQDGTAGAKDLYLNVLVDDADQDVTTTPCNLVMNGEIDITWLIGGDK